MFVFTITESFASSHYVTVKYATSNVTATAGTDYTATSGTLTFSPHAVSQVLEITVLVTGDTSDESDETFKVTLSDPFAAEILVAEGIGTITDDD